MLGQVLRPPPATVGNVTLPATMPTNPLRP
jgi:hypothetical protein